MLITLKTLHFLALWAAGAIGAGGWIIQSVHARNQIIPSKEVVKSLRLMGLLALISVTVLWITGYFLADLKYGGLLALPTFYGKLAAAAVLLLASLGTNLENLSAMRAARPPRAGLMNALAWTIRGSLLLVLVLTAMTFG